MSLGAQILAGRELDRAAVGIARSRGMLDLSLGEALAQLFDSRGLIRLGYVRQVDYSRERLGIPPRTMYGWVRLARSVAGRALLRQAVRDGSVTPRNAIAVAPLAIDGFERYWVAVAKRTPFKKLEHLLKAEGVGVPVEGYGNVESLVLRMPPDEQAQLDEAIALARAESGAALKRWQCVELICQEWLGEFGAQELVRPEEVNAALAPGENAFVQQLRIVRAAERRLTTRETPHQLDARIQELLKGRHNFDLAFGELAERIASTQVWRDVGCVSLKQYCRDRLGVAPRSFRERVWLERRMYALPLLREALRSRSLTYSKALLVAKDATVWDVEERIAEAADRSWQDTERESDEAEQRRNLAHGIRRVWGPEDVLFTISIAIGSAKTVAEASGLGEIDSGKALALIATHFIRVWKANRTRKLPRRRREVLMRHRGLCAVPGCSLPAEHEHHSVFRSRGGSNEAWNLVGLCAAHHLQGVHQGNLRVTGRADERLDWEFGNGERWSTDGGNSRAARPRRSDEGHCTGGLRKRTARANSPRGSGSSVRRVTRTSKSTP